MSDLYPTKARLALLQAVADGAVTEQYPMLPDAPFARWDRGPSVGLGGSRYLKVTARVEELYRAGWVHLGDKLGTHYKSPRRFELTDAGRLILELGP